MGKYNTGFEIPIGLGLALEEYGALDYFFSLTTEEQQQIIDNTHKIQSKNEMRTYVHQLLRI